MTDSIKRQRKSDRTRAAILAAAESLFAANGFERTTVRDIAERAAIDPAMVIRYFGSKDELFAQATVFDLKLPDLSNIDRESIGETLVRHFLNLWEGDQSNGGLPVLLRSAASHAYATSKLQELFMAQVLPAVARGGSRATAADRAGLVASQLLGVALCRYVLKLPPVVAMSQSTLVREVGRTIQRYATGT
jgi:AcrR family transcriptional regulator